MSRWKHNFKDFNWVCMFFKVMCMKINDDWNERLAIGKNSVAWNKEMYIEENKYKFILSFFVTKYKFILLIEKNVEHNFVPQVKKTSTNILYHYYKTRTHYSLHQELHFVFIFFLCNGMLYFRIGSLENYLWLLFWVTKMGDIFFVHGD